MITSLPPEVTSHLPAGRQEVNGIWLVLPKDDSARDGIESVNSWLRAEDWYPATLQDVIWFGEDGVGNMFGWRPDAQKAILWNPEDGDVPWKEGTVNGLWRFVLNGYKDEL